MDISPLIPKGHQLIEAYGEGHFRISGKEHQGSVMVFADHTVHWEKQIFAEIGEADFAAILTQQPKPEIIVLGSGREFGMVPPAWRALLRGHGIALEAMDTGGACRTYNILMAEGRRVAALLLAV